MTYSEIKEKYQNHNYAMFIDRYACALSPFFTKYFLKKNVIPNKITVFMMLSGILGAALFALPNLFAKIMGTVFIHIWYILDCSDGEVARITKRFSKFGKEIDYTAHIINHPLFNTAFLISMIQLNRYNTINLLCVFMVIIIVNLDFRNLVMFKSIYAEKMTQNNLNENVEPLQNKKTIKKIIVSILDNMTVYPNYALTFPIVHIIDLVFSTQISIIYTLAFMFISFIMVSLQLIRWVQKIVNI